MARDKHVGTAVQRAEQSQSSIAQLSFFRTLKQAAPAKRSSPISSPVLRNGWHPSRTTCIEHSPKCYAPGFFLFNATFDHSSSHYTLCFCLSSRASNVLVTLTLPLPSHFDGSTLGRLSIVRNHYKSFSPRSSTFSMLLAESFLTTMASSQQPYGNSQVAEKVMRRIEIAKVCLHWLLPAESYH